MTAMQTLASPENSPELQTRIITITDYAKENCNCHGRGTIRGRQAKPGEPGKFQPFAQLCSCVRRRFHKKHGFPLVTKWAQDQEQLTWAIEIPKSATSPLPGNPLPEGITAPSSRTVSE